MRSVGALSRWPKLPLLLGVTSRRGFVLRRSTRHASFNHQSSVGWLRFARSFG